MAKRQHHERDKIRRPAVKYMRHMVALNQFKRWKFFQWICPPDLGQLSPAQIGSMKADGYEAGVFDMTIIAATPQTTYVWLVEFKWQKGDYTDEQKVFAAAAEGTPVRALRIYSYDEFKLFVENNLF